MQVLTERNEHLQLRLAKTDDCAKKEKQIDRECFNLSVSSTRQTPSQLNPRERQPLTTKREGHASTLEIQHAKVSTTVAHVCNTVNKTLTLIRHSMNTAGKE